MSIVRRVIHKLFYFPRVDQRGEVRRRNAIALRAVQRLFEGPGNTTLLQRIAPLEQSFEYSTAAPVDPATFTANRIRAKYPLIEYLLSIFPEDPTTLRWLEVGCADAANLMVLRAAGVTQLSGFELNSRFLDAGRQFDPSAFGAITTQCSSAEAFFAHSQPESYDVILTCAVLQHINPASNHIFGRVAATTAKYVVTIESESQCALPIHYSRNYKRVMHRHGLDEVRSAVITKDLFPDADAGLIGYTIRIFLKCR